MATLALFWGSSFLLIKIALQALTPTQLAFGRILLGAAVLVLICLVQRLAVPTLGSVHGRRLWGRVLIAGLFASALPWTLLALGELTVPSGLAGVLNATTPLWTVLFGLVLARGGMPPRRLLGVALGFAGVLLIFAPWEDSGTLNWGAVACIGAAVSYGVGYVYIGHKLTASETQGLPPLALATMQMLAASALSAVALPTGGLSLPHWSPLALGAIALLGVFSTGIAFALNYRLIADEGATTASTVTYVVPIFSVLLGWLVLGEVVGWRTILGMAIVLVGVLLSRSK